MSDEATREEGTDRTATCRAAGAKGGARVVERYGVEFLREIGRKGGAATARTHGSEHFAAMGRKGGARQRELIELGRRLEAEEQANVSPTASDE